MMDFYILQRTAEEATRCFKEEGSEGRIVKK
jgi:hypothetical protein